METDIGTIEELYGRKWERHYQTALDKITKANDVIPANKKILLDFLQHLDSQEKAPRTKMRYVYTYHYVLQCMPNNKVCEQSGLEKVSNLTSGSSFYIK